MTPHVWLLHYHLVYISFHFIFEYARHWFILFHLCLRKCMSTCDDRACPRLNMVTLSQRQRSLTPSESQSACWFFDIERRTDKATHQMSNDWEGCRSNGFWQSAIYNLLAILCYFNCCRLSRCQLFCQNNSVSNISFCVQFYKIHLEQPVFTLNHKDY